MTLQDGDVLFEDNHLIAVHKPIGILSQGDKTGDDSIIESVKQYIKIKHNKPGNVYLANLHRLDRPVQGVLLFAKTSKAAERLNKAFRENKVHKTYLAIIENPISKAEGIVVSYLEKDSKTNQVNSFKSEHKSAKEARTLYKVIDKQNGKTLIELKPITGRSHQLRVHCALELKSPIVGDVKYGAQHKTYDRSLYLLARSIAFTHPVTKENMLIYSNIPLQKLWQNFHIY